MDKSIVNKTHDDYQSVWKIYFCFHYNYYF